MHSESNDSRICSEVQSFNDSRSALRSPDLNLMIREPALKFQSKSNDLWTRSEYPVLIINVTSSFKCFTIHVLKSQSESNDTRSDWSASKQRIILLHNILTDYEVSPITMFFFFCWNSKMNGSFELVFASESLKMNDRSHEFESIGAVLA